MAATINSKYYEKAYKKLQKLDAADPNKGKGSVANTSAVLARKTPLDRREARSGRSSAASPSGSAISLDEAERRRQENARLYVDPVAIKEIYFADFNATLRKTFPELRVKLIVSAVGMKQPKQPIKNRFGKITGIAKLGAVHTALQIGPVILEWDLTSLVYITPSVEFESFKALAVIDLDGISYDKFEKEHLDQICKMVVDWNGSKKYEQLGDNCQKFTETILDRLNLKNPFKGQSKIKKFLDNLDDMDRKEVPFEFDHHGTTYQFASHKELDQFCKDHQRDFPMGSEDWRLLKAFDRVYWLRYYAAVRIDEIDSTIKPEERERLIEKFSNLSKEDEDGEEQCDCPFSDPAGTATQWSKAPATPSSRTPEKSFEIDGGEIYHDI